MSKKLIYKYLFSTPSVRTLDQQQQSPSADSTMSERSLVPFALVNLLSSINKVDVNNISIPFSYNSLAFFICALTFWYFEVFVC